MALDTAEATCGGLNEKCPPKAPVSTCLISRWWWCLRLCRRHSLIGGTALGISIAPPHFPVCYLCSLGKFSAFCYSCHASPPGWILVPLAVAWVRVFSHRHREVTATVPFCFFLLLANSNHELTHYVSVCYQGIKKSLLYHIYKPRHEDGIDMCWKVICYQLKCT